MPNFLKTYATPICTSLSTTARNTPKNATVAMTTQVVAITSSRLGQVTCFISTRTSRRNSRVSATVPVTLLPNSEPIPPCDSSLPVFTVRVAMNPHSFTSTEKTSVLLNAGRGGGIRTPIPGFGDRSPNRWTTPLNSIPACSLAPTKKTFPAKRTYFTSLCAVCLRQELQNFFVSSRSVCFFLFFVVV